MRLVHYGIRRKPLVVSTSKNGTIYSLKTSFFLGFTPRQINFVALTKDILHLPF